MRWIIFAFFFLIPAGLFADGSGLYYPPLQVNDNGNIYYGFYYLLTISGGTTTDNADGTLSVNCGSVVTRFILLEDATVLLLEDGTKSLLE